MPEKTEQKPKSNQFTFLLGDIRKGALLEKCNDMLQKAVEEVREKGRAAEIVVKMKIAPVEGGDASRVTVSGGVSAKLPAEKAITALYYTNEDGGLQKNDPDQGELPLKAVVKAETKAEPKPAATAL